MAKKNLIVTPKGIAVFPALTTPDTKFDTAGVYKTGLKLSKEVAEPILEQIEKGIDQAVAEAQKDPKNKGKKIKRADPPYKLEVDDEGTETGNVIINFKMKASGVSEKTKKPWTRTPYIEDSKGKKVGLNGLRIYGGSELKIAFEIGTFYTALVGAGVSLRLEGVRIITLSEGNSAAANAFGDGEEDGFTVDESAAAESVFAGESNTTNESASAAQQGDF